MKTCIIDCLPHLGGQLSALYPEKDIFDVAGFPKIAAKDLVAMLTEQMMQHNPSVFLGEKVMKLEAFEDHVRVESHNGNVHLSKTAIIAAGRGAFTPRKLELQNIEELEGKGVHYFVGDKSIFAGKKLLIVGGGDSAFDWALNLHSVADGITMIHRSDNFRAHEHTVASVMELGVEMKTFHELKAIHGEERVEGATIYNNKTMDEMDVKCDDILLTLGFMANLGPIKDWGLELQGNYIRVNSRMETNIPRVFAAGDGIMYDGKLPLIATGFGDAATAVNHAYVLLNPGKKVFVHSSEASK